MIRSLRHPLFAVLTVTALTAAPVVFAAAAVAAPTIRGQAKEAAVAATATNKFEPATVTVAVGGTVTWSNPGNGFHSVTGGENGQQDPDSPINQPIGQFTSYKVTFTKAGTYPYFCIPHDSMGMRGTVTVGAGGGPTATASATPSATSSAAPTESAEPGEHVPGSTAEDNPTLKEIEDKLAANEGTIGGFNALLAAATAATVVLCVALFASTRTRRGGR